MKISEARQLYRGQINAYQEQKKVLSAQKQELEKKMKLSSKDSAAYANEAAVLELTLKRVDEKQTEYMDYMSKLMEQWSLQTDMVSAKQQSEEMSDYVENIGKIMEVARRLMSGAIVPASDEKKLMEYSMELYQAAKNMGVLAKQKEREEYDSLWQEEEENKVAEDAAEAADNTEAFAPGPEIVEIAEL